MISYAKSMMFNGHRPEEYGAVLASITSTLPAPRQITDTVPYRDGVYDFSRFDGSLHYDNRTITCVFNIVASDTDELNDRLGKLNDWLYSDGDGMLYDDHDAFWHYEEVCCTDIQKALILADQTAMQVTATMSAYPYKISNSGVKANAIETSGSQGILTYKPDEDIPILAWFSSSVYNSYSLADETISTVDAKHFTVTLSVGKYGYEKPTLIRISNVNSSITNISVMMNKKEYSPGATFGSAINIYLPKRHQGNLFYAISLYFTVTSLDDITQDEIHAMTYTMAEASSFATIGYEIVPIKVESAGLPTIKVTDSNNNETTYGPSDSSMDVKSGLYLLTVSGTTSKKLSLTYDSTKRRL
jgi:hypothetical protein